MRFAIAGYFGFGNVGDEAILESTATDLRKTFPGCALDIIGAEYCPTLSGPDVTLVPWTNWSRVLESLNACEWLIVGGGGVFTHFGSYSGEHFLRDGSDLAELLFGLPAAAFLAGKHSCIYAVGAGPFSSPVALEAARTAARLADVCTVRDRASRNLLADSPFERLRIGVHADPAFRIVNSPLPKGVLEPAGIRPGDVVAAVVARNWFGVDPQIWEPILADVLRDFAVAHSVRLLFIPFHALRDVKTGLNNDPEAIARLRARIGQEYTAELEHGLRPGEVSAILARCDMAVSIRLHGAVLSVRNATPFVALAYKPKVSTVLGRLGLERYVMGLPRTPAEGEALKRLIEEVWANRTAVRQELAEAAREASDDAGGHVEALRRAVENPPTRQIDAKTGAFLADIAGRQTQRLAAEAIARKRAADEAASLRTGLRNLVNSGHWESALLLARDWTPNERVAEAEREYFLGLCIHVLQGDVGEAKAHYAAALELGFDEFWIVYNRGQLLLRLGELEAARRDLERALALRPDSVDTARLIREISPLAEADGPQP